MQSKGEDKWSVNGGEEGGAKGGRRLEREEEKRVERGKEGGEGVYLIKGIQEEALYLCTLI